MSAKHFALTKARRAGPWTGLQSGFTLKSYIVCFAVVLGFYLATFHAIEYWRHKDGPWEVTFRTDERGRPAVAVSQRALDISAVTITFPDNQAPQKNLQENVSFDRPLKAVPFGKKIYEDLTFLPGVVTFDFFGNEIELLPRVLIVNKREIAWQSGRTIELATTNRPLAAPRQ